MQEFKTLSTKLVNFKDKGHRLQLGIKIKDKTCNSLLNIYHLHPIIILNHLQNFLSLSLYLYHLHPIFILNHLSSSTYKET
ncbi:hypothetical protein Hanom_Chr04g00371211 [Helianthus anomalus]